MPSPLTTGLTSADVTAAVPSAPPMIAWTDSGATTLQAAAGGTGNGSNLAVAVTVVAVTLDISGGVGTIIPEESYDGGTTWVTANVENQATGSLVASVTSAVAHAYYKYVPGPKVTHLRARISAFVSGLITVDAYRRQLS